MKKSNVGMIIRIAALVCVLIFAVTVLIYGVNVKFGIPDLIRKPENAVRETPYVYEEEVKTLRGIEVDWVSGPVTLKFYGGEKIRITETAKKEISEDDKLYLEVSGGTVSVKWNSSRLHLGLAKEDAKQLEIEIPNKFSETIESVRIKTVSGDIGIDGLTVKEAEFKSTSGEQHLSNITAESFEASSVSGEIFCRGVVGSEEYKISSTSGDMELEGVSGGDMQIDTTSGEIEMEGTAEQLQCAAVSGSVKLDLNAWPAQTKIESVSGDVKLYAPDTRDGFLCNVSTSSGDFDCGFETQKSGSLYQHGAGKNSINISTTSGDISLQGKVG